MSTRKPAVCPAFVTFLTAMVVFLAGSLLVLGVAVGWAIGSGEPAPSGINALTYRVAMRPGVMFWSMLVGDVCLAAVALVAARIETRQVATRLRLNGVPRLWMVVALGAIALIASGQVAESAVAYLGVGRNSSLMRLTQAIVNSSSDNFVLLLLAGSIGAGLAEELLFRGHMQPVLVQRWGRWPGILVTSALFGLMHMDYLHTPIAFGIGVGLGWIADRFGSARPTIVIHALNNLLAFLFARYGVLMPTGPSGHLLLAGGSLMVALVFWFWLSRVAPLTTTSAEPAVEPSMPSNA